MSNLTRIDLICKKATYPENEISLYHGNKRKLSTTIYIYIYIYPEETLTKPTVLEANQNT